MCILEIIILWMKTKKIKKLGYLCFHSTDNAGFAKAVGPISGSPLLLAVSLSFKYSVDLEPMGNEIV